MTEIGSSGRVRYDLWLSVSPRLTAWSQPLEGGNLAQAVGSCYVVRLRKGWEVEHRRLEVLDRAPLAHHHLCIVDVGVEGQGVGMGLWGSAHIDQ